MGTWHRYSLTHIFMFAADIQQGSLVCLTILYNGFLCGRSAGKGSWRSHSSGDIQDGVAVVFDLFLEFGTIRF